MINVIFSTKFCEGLKPLNTFLNMRMETQNQILLFSRSGVELYCFHWILLEIFPVSTGCCDYFGFYLMNQKPISVNNYSPYRCRLHVSKPFFIFQIVNGK